MKFSRELCDRATKFVSAQPDADLILRKLGLVEQPGHNTQGAAARKSAPIMRRALWDEPIVGSLSNVSRAGDGLAD